MAFSTINKSSLHQNNIIYTGTNSGETVSGVGFQPDLNWTKQRTGTENHVLVNSVRGVTKTLYSNTTDDDGAVSDGLTAFNSDGYVHGSNNAYCEASNTFVSWNWKANGSGSANTDGSINSTVSANTTAGFSIVQYQSDGTDPSTVGHGLGVVPQMIITKVVSASGDNWKVYHAGSGNTKVLELNSTIAQTTSDAWNVTTPTSSVFTVGNDGATNGSGKTIIAYCFAENDSRMFKTGTYVGNANTDGIFINTMMRPSLVLIKYYTGAGQDWYINTNAVNGYNVQDNFLAPNEPAAEVVDNTAMPIDMLSNGFKIRGTGNGVGGNGNGYIYMAWGQPIVSNSGIASTAR